MGNCFYFYNSMFYHLFHSKNLFCFHNGHHNGGVTDLFKQNHLNLDIKCNRKCVYYLDIKFNLTTGLFKPYNKTNNIHLSVNPKSNHPPFILKEILDECGNYMHSTHMDSSHGTKKIEGYH